MQVEVFRDKAALVDHAFDLVLDALKQGLENKGTASLMCSGGSTPGPLYERLSRVELDWQHVNIGLVDDRWVPPEHDRSNEKLLRQTLLKDNARHASFFPMYKEGYSALAATVERDAEFSQIPLPLDVIILGMGPDGHSLSWFPEAEGLKAAMDPENENLIAATYAKRSDVTGDELERMTLTYKAVNNADLVILMITGDDKRAVFESDDSTYPVRVVQKAAGKNLVVLCA
jgi:6-phosphogluconolactonase